MKRIYIIALLFHCTLSLTLLADNLSSLQNKTNSEYEIEKIKFTGNNTYSADILKEIIFSRETKRSTPHKLFRFAYESISQNQNLFKCTPKAFTYSLELALLSMSNEVKYFNKTIANNDVISLKTFYNQNGFHNAEISYKFFFDTLKKLNTLEFHIEENERYTIKSVQYSGLENIDKETYKLIEKAVVLKQNMFFSEQALLDEITTINNILLDNGYYYTTHTTPIIYQDAINKTDSIIITFSPGKRQKIAHIKFVDSTRNQHIIVDEMKKRQLDFSIGEWYSKSKITQSITNLLSLGTFENVVIDTSSNFYPQTDSTLSLVITSIYRKQQEYGAALLINQTTFDKSINFGAEISYFHNNIFGAAQAINPFVRFLFLDISRNLSEWTKSEYEFQIGINLSQPLLFSWDKAKIGLSFQLLYAIRTINQTLRLTTISLPIKFPIRLPGWTYFKNMNIDISFENQRPQNLSEALSKALKQAKSIEDTLKTFEAFKLYSNLENFISNYNPILTTNTLGFTIIGDTRNNPFSPTSGYFAALSIDGLNFLLYPFELLTKSFGAENKLLGISKYIRFQLNNNWFWKLNPNLVLALKQREGFIYWWDKTNSYLPFERQFFAGGANSVRAWPSRKLRYKIEYDKTTTQNPFWEFATDYIGSASIIEGSLEFRYHFPKPTFLSGGIAEQLVNFGITTFIDWGNTFNWLVFDEKGEYVLKSKWYEYISNLAIAAGIGLRYETPIGPIRIDFAWPIFDPAREKDKTIFTRFNAFNQFQFHIALGNAF